MSSAAPSPSTLAGPVAVCVDRPILSLDRPFTYDLPGELEAGLGSLVQVPFHGRPVPEIYAASKRFGAVLENVVLGANDRVPDFDDGSKTENTRSAYPLDFIPNASRTGCAPHPKNVVMLAADAFGVMPPIAKLTPAQAMYHFLSGYTAKVAGTERGLRQRAAAGILDLLRFAVPAARSVGLRQHAARS